MLAVVDGIGHQIAQDAFHATGIHLGDDLFVGHVELDGGIQLVGQVLNRGHHRFDSVAQIHLLYRQFSHAGVVSRDFQQVGEQRFESIELVDHQLGGPL
ncbi:Uncharacterised protein [Mycobacteroides abscessus subsp. abscessus]|nr:Uncharacterised protein [Mycobacteroides abscessus subsp. abscessus]